MWSVPPSVTGVVSDNRIWKSGEDRTSVNPSTVRKGTGDKTGVEKRVNEGHKGVSEETT